MFKEERYATAGVTAKIPIEVQSIMWQMIDKLIGRRNFTLDYLQTFNLESILIDDHVFLEITHKQEVEPYTKTVLVGFSQLINAKILIKCAINEEGHEYSCMMLAEEY